MSETLNFQTLGMYCNASKLGSFGLFNDINIKVFHFLVSVMLFLKVFRLLVDDELRQT